MSLEVPAPCHTHLATSPVMTSAVMSIKGIWPWHQQTLHCPNTGHNGFGASPFLCHWKWHQPAISKKLKYVDTFPPATAEVMRPALPSFHVTRCPFFSTIHCSIIEFLLATPYLRNVGTTTGNAQEWPCDPTGDMAGHRWPIANGLGPALQ